MTILPYNTTRGYWHKMKMQFFYENPIFYDVGQNFYTFFFLIRFFSLKKKKKNPYMKKKCAKILPNVVKNRVFVKKLHFHFMPISTLRIVGQNGHFHYALKWAYHPKMHFFELSKKLFLIKISNHTCCVKKKMCGKFKYFPRLHSEKICFFKKNVLSLLFKNKRVTVILS